MPDAHHHNAATPAFLTIDNRTPAAIRELLSEADS